MNTPKQSWEEEFDEKYIPSQTFAERKEWCREFLRETLTQQRQEALTSDRHAIGEMILEWVESKRINLAVPPNNEIVSAALAGVDTTLTDLQTFIKSEVMGKE